jgi:asparagine synthase (glutamine-hydrolysing)
VEASRDELDLTRAVACIEDYRPLDVQCAAVERAFLRGLRAAAPRLAFLFDGDGADENWKSYPPGDSDLTIRSVLNNPLLYHEGWGVDSIKHSLTYSGGLSRGVVRGFAPAREFGFRLLSPHAMRPAIRAALAAPLRDLVGEDVERLLALKGRIADAGLRSLGFPGVPIAPKKRFQHGAVSDSVFRERLTAGRPELRRIHEARFAGFAEPGGKEEAGASRRAAWEKADPPHA